MKTHIYTHPCFLKHDTGPGHPERPARLEVLFDLFKEKPFNTLPIVEAQEAQRAWILRAHDERYYDALQEAIPDDGLGYLDGDTCVSPGSWEAAVKAAGAVCQAVDDVMTGKADRAFCAVRPPGHHAFPGHAEGFCLFNNIFIGALHAQAAHKMSRVAVVDFDVHHGNGSDYMARRHENVFYASTHQWPLYPGTGLPEDNIKGRVVNIPLAAGDGSTAFRNAWSGAILPALDEFKPELLMISAGFDAHRDDPLANINLVEDDFRWITDEYKKIAANHCGGRIISVLEGGYNVNALKSSVAAHLSSLANL
ncbi:MAG TPA: histone deacetylase family protein [Patescibacteria group bacterium]|nr:histone deacetylase family protein [Patescibacteria group bacterium]